MTDPDICPHCATEGTDWSYGSPEDAPEMTYVCGVLHPDGEPTEACTVITALRAETNALRDFAADAITDWENEGDFDMSRALRERLAAI